MSAEQDAIARLHAEVRQLQQQLQAERQRPQPAPRIVERVVERTIPGPVRERVQRVEVPGPVREVPVPTEDEARLRALVADLRGQLRQAHRRVTELEARPEPPPRVVERVQHVEVPGLVREVPGPVREVPVPTAEEARLRRRVRALMDQIRSMGHEPAADE